MMEQNLRTVRNSLHRSVSRILHWAFSFMRIQRSAEAERVFRFSGIPTIGQNVSVATFEIKKDLRIYDFAYS